MSDEISRAERRGREQALLELVDVIDDCDRAMDLIYSASRRDRIAEGVEKMRSRLLHRFEAAGLRPYGRPGDKFDPHRHQAIAAEPCFGPDGQIIKVHRRGWLNAEGQVVRTAVVTICRGTPAGPPPRQREQRPREGSGGCPYGTPGCPGGECASCRFAEAGGGRR